MLPLYRQHRYSEDTKRFAASLGSTMPSAATQERRSSGRSVLYMKVDPPRNAGTFYIGKDGKILYVDRQVKAATAGADAVARLKELKIL